MFKNNDKTEILCYNSLAMDKCPKCGSIHFVKNGNRKTKGKILKSYWCKECNFQFTENTKRKKSLKEISIAIALYEKGLSLRLIAKMFGLKSASTIYYWIKKYKDTSQKFTNKELENFVRKSHINGQVTNNNYKYFMKFLASLRK